MFLDGEKRYKKLLEHGFFLELMDSFPYPIAIFLRSGVLAVANQALLQETGLSPKDISQGNINILSRITTENYSVLEAMKDVFLGEARLLSELVNWLSIFTDDNGHISAVPFQSAIFFPIIEGDGCIKYGAVMFIR